MCQSELRGLGAVHARLAEKGGGVLAISVDPPAKAKRVVEANKLPFLILCDESRDATDLFGVLHRGGGPEGQDIPLPAMFLVARDGSIVWRRVAQRVQDRPSPAEVLEAIEANLP
jgi:peroxiredoxin